MPLRIAIVAGVGVLLVLAWQQFGPRSPAAWTEADLKLMASLSIDSLPPLPPDPTNAVADDPRAADLGHRLFFDTRMSANGAVDELLALRIFFYRF